MCCIDRLNSQTQTVVGLILIVSLAFHVASVGLVGLMVIVLLTAFNGIVEEHSIGHAFEGLAFYRSIDCIFRNRRRDSRATFVLAGDKHGIGNGCGYPAADVFYCQRRVVDD